MISVIPKTIGNTIIDKQARQADKRNTQRLWKEMRGRQGGVTTEACLTSGTSKQDDYAVHSSLESFSLAQGYYSV